jgi:hypothetical protein
MMGVPWSDGTGWAAGWGPEVIHEEVGNMNINVNLMWPFGHCATGPKIKFKTGLVCEPDADTPLYILLIICVPFELITDYNIATTMSTLRNFNKCVL